MSLLLVLGFAGVAVLILVTQWKSISRSKMFKLIRYHIYYTTMGGVALADDMIYRRHNKTELPLRSGQTAIVTGGARGIGLEVVKKLLQCDMHVVIACRSVEAGQNAIKDLKESGINSGSVECMELDVGTIASVKNFAKKFLESHQSLHVLVNNAGIMFVPRKLTEDGFESHFAVNYLGHFLLTHLLLNTLKASGRKDCYSRVVNVSSCAHTTGTIKFQDHTMKDLYIPSASYAQSKLAQVMFTKKLNSMLKDEGAYVQIHAIHPGLVNTELFNGTYVKNMAPWMPMLFFKSPEEGSRSILHAAVSEKVEGKGGTYIDNCREVSSSRKAEDKAAQDKLWDMTHEVLKIKDFGNVEC